MMKRTLDNRLAEAISHRLHVPVSFLRWVHNDRMGYDTPVFGVPQHVISQATALGFQAWQFESAGSVQP